MRIEIKLLDEDMEIQYNELLDNSSNAMFNHSLKYRKFLTILLEGSPSKYYCLFLDGHLEAALPVFIKESKFANSANTHCPISVGRRSK